MKQLFILFAVLFISIQASVAQKAVQVQDTAYKVVLGKSIWNNIQYTLLQYADELKKDSAYIGNGKYQAELIDDARQKIPAIYTTMQQLAAFLRSQMVVDSSKLKK